MALPKLTPNQIEQIAHIMGDTDRGFKNSEIEHHLTQCRMDDPDPGLTKWKRLYNAFCFSVNGSGSTNAVFQFMVLQKLWSSTQGIIQVAWHLTKLLLLEIVLIHSLS